jgi:hypothetical protein
MRGSGRRGAHPRASRRQRQSTFGIEVRVNPHLRYCASFGKISKGAGENMFNAPDVFQGCIVVEK